MSAPVSHPPRRRRQRPSLLGEFAARVIDERAGFLECLKQIVADEKDAGNSPPQVKPAK
jgi:hypothetical protein